VKGSRHACIDSEVKKSKVVSIVVRIGMGLHRLEEERQTPLPTPAPLRVNDTLYLYLCLAAFHVGKLFEIPRIIHCSSNLKKVAHMLDS